MRIREAGVEDVEWVVSLIQELAGEEGEPSTISSEYVVQYLAFPGTSILLAESEEGVQGLLSYSIRPDLFHAGDCCLIEALVVGRQARRQGVGSALVKEVSHRAASAQCAELSVSTMPDNEAALSFYRKNGFGDEAVLLERHL